MSKDLDSLDELLLATAIISLESRVAVIVDVQINQKHPAIFNGIISSIETMVCTQAVKVCGSKWKAAKALGIDYKTINNKLRKGKMDS